MTRRILSLKYVMSQVAFQGDGKNKCAGIAQNKVNPCNKDPDFKDTLCGVGYFQCQKSALWMEINDNRRILDQDNELTSQGEE